MADDGNTKTRKGKAPTRSTEKRISHCVHHPVRLDALSILLERPASPSEISELLQVSVPDASFHVNELRKNGAIELVDTEPRRGALMHRYRAKQGPEVTDDGWRSLPMPSRREIAALAVQAIVAESLSAVRHKTMENDDELHLTWMPMRLDAEGRRELAELQRESLAKLEEIRVRSESRLPEEEAPDEPPRRIAVLMSFDRGTRRRSKRQRSAEKPAQ